VGSGGDVGEGDVGMGAFFDERDGSSSGGGDGVVAV
jgi:hypothetical protein